MSFDKNRYEKQAIAYLARGSTDKALELYARILRSDPRDRRIRQKLAELYQKTGRIGEAEKQYREVAKLYGQDGNYRAQIAVLKQLIRLKPQDGGLVGMLGEAYQGAGKPIEAEKLFEQAYKALAKHRPEEAARYIGHLLRYRHGDTPLKLKRAELLVAAKKNRAAYEAYREVIEDFRRRGKVMEVGRIAALALALQPDQDDLLQDAAEAALAQGEPQKALRHLQVAFQKHPRDARTLELLARAFEAAAAPAKAKHVLKQLAGVLAAAGDHGGRLAALERAVQVGGEDAALSEEIQRARVAEAATAFRLFELDSAAPRDEAELRACTRAEVFIRYGFPGRVRPEVERALEAAPQSLALLAAAAEVAAAEGDGEGALRFARAVLRGVPAAERARVELRVAVLEGRDPADVAPVQPEPEEDLLDDDEDFLDDEPAPPAVADELLDDEDDLLDDLPAASPPVASELEDDPFAGDDEEDEDRERRSSGGLLDDVFGGQTFAEVDPAECEDPLEGQIPDDAPLRGLLHLGLGPQVRIQVAGRRDLGAQALSALAAAPGEEREALSELRDAFDLAGLSDPGAPEALYAMICLSARQEKFKVAMRFLGLLEKTAPGHRAEAVREVRLALEALLE